MLRIGGTLRNGGNGAHPCAACPGRPIARDHPQLSDAKVTAAPWMVKQALGN